MRSTGVTCLPPTRHRSCRYEPFLDTWVIYASHRRTGSYLPSAANCPLCPTRDHPTEIPAADYEVVVFDNRFPALSAPPGTGHQTEPGALLPRAPGGRAHRGCCLTPRITTCRSPACPPERVELLLEALIDRTAVLSALPGIDQVFAFENRGREIGVTQPHPHGRSTLPVRHGRTSRSWLGPRLLRRTPATCSTDVVAASGRTDRRVVTQTATGRRSCARGRWARRGPLVPASPGTRSEDLVDAGAARTARPSGR